MKTVLVTGATGAIGEAIVKEFAAMGYFVYIHYNSNEAKAQNLLEAIDGNGEVTGFNLRDKESVESALEKLEVDVLVNNAGIIKDNLFFFMEDEQWFDVIDTNLNGVYYVTKQLAKKMIAKKAGSIVNVTSISGLVGNAGQTNYSASKGGVIAFTKALSAELARYGIRVNAVAPGVIESEMTEGLDTKAMKKAIPANRLGKPEEVAEAVGFLGDRGSYINGTVLTVSGGMVR